MGERKTSGVAWLTLGVAVLALILAWIAFNRTGENLDVLVKEEVQKATVEIRADLESAREQVRESASEALKEGSDKLDEASEEVAN